MKPSTAPILPHITVATIIQKDDKFLLVVEAPDDTYSGAAQKNNVYNQPAGHMEINETLFQAAIRETLEETGWHVELKYFLGVSHYHSDHNGITYVRHSFVADALYHDKAIILDSDIVDTEWLTYEEILERKNQLRSPLVLHDIESFLSGKTYELEILKGFI